MRRIPPSLLPFLVAVSLDLAFASSAAHRPHGHLRIDIQSAHDNEGVDAREVMPSRQRAFSRHLSEATCIGSSLQPSQELYTNQFLCRGQQRFGILDGRLILGLSNVDTSDTVTPDQIAWQAAPTTLFVECSRPFYSLELSSDGNLLGYDSDGYIIYDSDLDYGNRIDGKVAGSILGFSTSCYGSGLVGALCLKLTGPPGPGMPWGAVTWGVSVDFDSLLTVDSSASTDAIALNEVGVSTDYEAISLSFDTDEASIFDETNTDIPPPSEQESTTTPNYLPTTSPIIKSQSIVYGSIWLDDDSNGSMDVGEKPISGITVELYECDATNNTRNELVDTKVTDAKGWYVFQVPIGSYKAYFDIVELQVYKFTDGKDTHTTTGWTDCASPTLQDPIQWNAGLHNVVTADRVPAAAAKEPAIANSKIGGAIFIDLNGDGSMDSAESNAVENGYTVNDAKVHVSIHDCEDNIIIQSSDVAFPGTYSFEDLTEGLYKVEFDIVSLKSNKVNKESRLPLYSFYAENDDSSSFETNCINLRRNDSNNSVHAGIRIPKFKVNTKVSEELLGQMEELNVPPEPEITIQSAEVVEKEQSMAGAIVGIVSGIALLVGTVVFIYKRQQLQVHAVTVEAGSVTDDLSVASNPADNEADVHAIVVETKTENVSNNDDDDHSSSTAEEAVNSVKLDIEFQRNPYNRSAASSIFESESLDSDPYIFTGDEQESVGSDPYIHTRDLDTWKHAGYPRPSKSGAAETSYQQASYVSAEQTFQSYYQEDSSVVSNQSSDPPAASYKDIPSTAQVYHQEHYHPSHATTPAFYPNEYVPTQQQQVGNYQETYVTGGYQSKCTSTEYKNEYPFESDESSSSESDGSFSRSSSKSMNDMTGERRQGRSAPSHHCHTGLTQEDALPSKQHHPEGGSSDRTAWTHDDIMSNHQHDSTVYPEYYAGPIIDDQSVISAQPDQSADPPGASYQILTVAASGYGLTRASNQSSYTPPTQPYHQQKE